MMVSRRWRAVSVVTLLIVVAAGAFAVFHPSGSGRLIVAHFTSVVGIHTGSDVRVLGVKIGEVVAVRPEGRTVRVELRYDPRTAIPGDARAVIIPPSVVSDRYVQLTPAYTGGPELADGADLPTDRTAVPLELDDVYKALDQFNTALGPAGANRTGALSDLVGTAAANLDGNGANLGSTLDGFANTLGTLAAGREDLFGSLVDLQQLVTVLARSDQQVQLFNQQLATASQELASQGADLAGALRSLATALADITGFVRDNRELLKSDVAALTDVTTILARQQRAIAEVLDTAPLALSNLNLAYNGRSGTLDTRDDVMGPYDPANYVCSLMVDLVPVAQIPAECTSLAKTLDAAHLPLTNELRKLLGLPPSATAPSTGGTAGAGSGAGGSVDPIDPTLGGILKVGR
jgi:phospholipid/cholesterol/gamma-HCH transport system substrate-binding protein